MSTKTKSKLSDFRVINLPNNSIGSPTFLTTKVGRLVYEEYQRQKAEIFGNNPYLKLQYQNGTVTNSTLFDVTLINQIIEALQGNPRTPLPLDLSDPRVLAMIHNQFYADSQAAVLRSLSDSYNVKNEPLAASLAEHIDIARLAKEPALMHGFTLEPWHDDKKGYDLLLVPREGKFIVHYDDRLTEKWNCYKFDKVDSLGLPINLSESKGSRTWYTRADGLSRLYLNRDLNLNSNYDNLDNSNADGRVVVLGGEATAQNFASDLTAKLNEAYETKRRHLESEKARLESEIAKLGQ